MNHVSDAWRTCIKARRFSLAASAVTAFIDDAFGSFLVVLRLFLMRLHRE